MQPAHPCNDPSFREFLVGCERQDLDSVLRILERRAAWDEENIGRPVIPYGVYTKAVKDRIAATEEWVA